MGQRGGHPDPDSVVESYRRGELDVLILSSKVGQHGLTLTNTRTIIYVDLTFEMEPYLQSLARVRRFGLKHEPLLITIRAETEIEALVEANLTGKAVDIEKISNDELSKLLQGAKHDDRRV